MTAHHYDIGDHLVTGHLSVENVDGAVRPVIATDEARIILSVECVVDDVCTDDRIPVWRDGRPVTTRPGRVRLFEGGPDDASLSTVVAVVPNYVLVERHGHR